MRILTTLFALNLAATSYAQTIYEPVTVQYGGQNTYYYAGQDPHIHQAATFPSAPGAAWGRTGGYAFVNSRRAVVERTPRIFTDDLGSFDARVYGMTIDDVVNQANASLPRYFTKNDLVNSGNPQPDGTIVVSPYAPKSTGSEPRIIIKPSQPPLFRRGPVLVIPKSMMDRKVSDAAGTKNV